MNARHRTRLLPLLLLTALPILALTLAGCGSDNPAAPATDDTSGLPAIPKLADYGGNPLDQPTTSAVAVSIRPWTGTFRPTVVDMNTTYSASTLVEETNPFGGTWTVARSLGTYTGWADQIPGLHTFDAGVDGEAVIMLDPFGGAGARLKEPLFPVVSDGDGTDSFEWSLDSQAGHMGSGLFPVWGDDRLVTWRAPVESTPALEAPHIKREVWWVRGTISDQDYKIMPPGSSYTEGSSWTMGVSRSESQEFFWSLTVEVSGGWGPVSASVSATVGQTFNTTLTVSEEHTEESSETYNAPADHGIMLSRWILVQRYTLCDAGGDPYMGDHFRFADMELVVPTEARVVQENYDGKALAID